MIGIGRNRWRGRQLEERAKRLREFRKRLTAYIASQGRDGQAYAEVTARVERMQRDVGTAAIAALY